MLLLNGEPVNVTIFPDKTSQVWKIPDHVFLDETNVITWKFESESELMHLAQLQHLLIQNNQNTRTTLLLPYLPYGRQDKEVSNNATFALSTFHKIIDAFGFYKIIIVDPHNLQSIRFKAHIETVYPIETVQQVAKQTECEYFCYPDKGAYVKYSKIFRERQCIIGEKVRNQLTGDIESYKINGNPRDKNILIVDDICDGGMTFRILAKDLLAAGAKSVILFVTHGIFSRGLQVLKDSGIQRIFTIDGEVNENAGQLTYRRL